ncbi:SusC/RagA family TonB-linked outer membrane protein [Prolixibacter sp. SD074]|nr:SusC/RagA family TonB-linked outer membrane protein [Prolixibacter sp. SD074]
MTLSAKTYSQAVRLNLQVENANIVQVFDQIEKSSEFGFFFKTDQMDLTKRYNLSIENASIDQILSQVLDLSKYKYQIVDRNIVISKRSVETAQNGQQNKHSVNGTVRDEDGVPLPGVTIVIKGTTTGTITDTNGNYTLKNIPGDGTLVFSFVGMKSQEIPVANRSKIDVVLKESSVGLQEVVAIGYGTMKRSDLTGSVAQVKNEELSAVPVYNMEQSLQAVAAGVQVTQNSGQPGGRIEVRIRGGNSMIGDNQPLYVVDGFPVTGGIDFLNPSDIASVDILKDASATAIYGARGANGVVIITSKKGAAGQKGKVEINSYYGIQQTINRYNLLNAKEYATIANEWLKNEGLDSYFDVNQIQNPGTNWQDVIFRNAPIQDHTITFSGSSNKTQYSFSGNFFDQQGIIINTGVKRGSMRLNLNHELNKWLKMAVNLVLTRKQVLSVPVDNGYRGSGSVLSAAAAAPPTLPVYDENGLPYQIEKAYNFGSADMRNPLLLAMRQSKTLTNSIVGNTALTFNVTKDLSFTTRLGLEYVYSWDDYFEPLVYPHDRGYVSQTIYYRNSFLNENTMTYSKKFNDENNLTFTGGYTYQTYMLRNLGSSASGFSNNTTRYYDLSAAETIGTPSTSFSQWTLASWLARANYSLKNKYLFTASIRADGSSRFGKNNKWGTFPSGALGWRISQEPFMQNLPFIYNLKLRASYGITGNTALNPYQSLDRLDSKNAVYGGQTEVVGYIPAGISNPNLKWETTAQTDVGFDFGVLNNRIRLTADYYKKTTTNLLAYVPLPPSIGFGSILENIGEIQNQGFEFTVNADILNKKVKWNVAANLSTNKNKVVKLAGGSDILGSGQFAVWSNTNIARVGEPLGAFYGNLEDGLDENGFIKYKDISEPDGKPDGVVNSLDRTILGNPNPKFFYGLTSNLSWKNLELNVILDGVYGNKIFNATNGSILNSFQRGTNQDKRIIGNYWTTENPNPNAKYPKISSLTSVDISDRFIEDGSYLRVRSIRLAYNLPIKKWRLPLVDFAQVYLSGINLFTFTKYTGLDPEVNTKGTDSQDVGSRLDMGYDQSGYPNAKSYSVGLKLNF